MLPQLRLHKQYLPALISGAAFDGHPKQPESFTWRLDDVLLSDIFDCHALPLAFVDDTGDAAFQEGEQTKFEVRLPGPLCYFEYADGTGILAKEIEVFDKLKPGRNFPIESGDDYLPPTVEVEFYVFSDTFNSDYAADAAMAAADNHGHDEPHGSFPNGAYDDEDGVDDFCYYFGDGVAPAAKRLLGTIALLNEKLLATQFEPDPAPRLTIARAKRGRLPITSDRYVVTINVGAVRRQAARTSLHAHEPPLLHWRRGHWRLLHRGSEFEKRTWIRRCLVGDPDKGYLGRRDFRLVWNQPLIAAGG